MAQIGGVEYARKNFLPRSQAALARVQNVRSRHGIRQNLPETCTFLMVLCWVWYDHYRGRYSQLKKSRLPCTPCREFQCKDCEYTTPAKWNLERHRKIKHTGKYSVKKKPYLPFYCMCPDIGREIEPKGLIKCKRNLL